MPTEAQAPPAGDPTGWPFLPPTAADEPVALVDLDGTLRGDVLPMVRLVRPLLPSYANKVLLREPLGAYKLALFLLSLLRLWTLRALHSRERKRYKRLFSELHHLAAAMLHDTPVALVRERYRRGVGHLSGLWNEGGVELLRRLTARCTAVVVTGSEQVQTEECVLLLGEQGVDTDRVLVQGSLYARDAQHERYTGGVRALNVSMDGKRDVVRRFLWSGRCRIVAAFGNSRPDRALFEAVEPGGLRALVCPRRVVADRAASFVVRKLERSGFQVCWTAADYLAAAAAEREGGPPPVLATDARFAGLLDDPELVARYAELLGPPTPPGGAARAVD